MQQWGVNYWENYAPVVNWISVRLLLYIASIHEFPSISIDFVPAFPQDDLDVYLFIYITLVMVFYGNREYFFLNLNKSLYGLNQTSVTWLDPLKTGLEDSGYHQYQV